MIIFEIFIASILVIVSIIYIIQHVVRPFIHPENPCAGCPYAGECIKKS